MKKLLTLFIFSVVLSTSNVLAQNSALVSKGSLGVGFHIACPQNDFYDINYDEGFGLNLSYLSRKYPFKSKLNFQIGLQMDFANMQSKDFKEIELADPGIIGNATIQVSNKMYGGFLVGRINFGNDDDKVVPYINLLAGHRNFNTTQYISLDRPSENPNIESDSLTNKVVFTKRPHFGGGIGLNYRVNNSLSLEVGATFTFGQEGAVLPLQNVTRRNNGNEIQYRNYLRSETDMLLINVGIRLHLFKSYRYVPYTPSTPQIPQSPEYTRYRDRQNIPTRIESNPNTDPTFPSSPKKAPIRIKPDGPKKKENSGS